MDSQISSKAEAATANLSLNSTNSATVDVGFEAKDLEHALINTSPASASFTPYNLWDRKARRSMLTT